MRKADSTAVVTENPHTDDASQHHTATFVLGHWEKGALQVLVDAVLGFFDEVDSEGFLSSLGNAETTLGSDKQTVENSLEHLRSLVRGFSQADDVVITATVRN